MGFCGILDLKEVPVKESPRTAIFDDLNLSMIIDEISLIFSEDVLRFYRYFPKDFEAESFRREITGDIYNIPGVFDGLSLAYEKYKQYLEITQKKENARQQVSKMFFDIEKANLYLDFCEIAYDSIKSVSLSSKGLKDFRDYLTDYLKTPEFLDYKEKARALDKALNNARFSLLYDNDRIILSDYEPDKEEALESEEVSEFEKQVSIVSVLERIYPNNKTKLISPFSNNDDVVGIEKSLLEIFFKKHPDIVKLLKVFSSKYESFEEESILKFFDEIAFYISFIKFARFYENKGASFCKPMLDPNDKIHAEGLYDLALFIANSKRNKEVVCNDFYYGEDSLFFVLTGPNQGGKTTFARSLGQLVFFTKMGLYVPCKNANLQYFESLITHFSVEESVETGRGKLMEELVRLKPMMDMGDKECFVVINELFTTAANYDAIIMGKKVLSHFIDRGCHGIYVTHLSELLEEEPRATGLSAELSKEGIQTFKILRETKKYENCAVNQINKYNLSYEALKERLS